MKNIWRRIVKSNPNDNFQSAHSFDHNKSNLIKEELCLKNIRGGFIYSNWHRNFHSTIFQKFFSVKIFWQMPGHLHAPDVNGLISGEFHRIAGTKRNACPLAMASKNNSDIRGNPFCMYSNISHPLAWIFPCVWHDFDIFLKIFVLTSNYTELFWSFLN